MLSGLFLDTYYTYKLNSRKVLILKRRIMQSITGKGVSRSRLRVEARISNQPLHMSDLFAAPGQRTWIIFRVQ